MNRADAVIGLVAQRMGDHQAIFDALFHAACNARREGADDPILIDIASALASASDDGISQAHRETIATRLLHTLERYARAALTKAAESDIPMDDEESDE